MWLKNTRNDTYYPYSEFLEKHSGMIRVYDNPFDKKITAIYVEEPTLLEEIKESEEATEEVIIPEEVIIKKEVLTPKKIVKRAKPKPKTVKQVKK